MHTVVYSVKTLKAIRESTRIVYTRILYTCIHVYIYIHVYCRHVYCIQPSKPYNPQSHTTLKATCVQPSKPYLHGYHGKPPPAPRPASPPTPPPHRSHGYQILYMQIQIILYYSIIILFYYTQFPFI